MEVVAATPTTGTGVPPFHDHDVREWSRLDSLTGVLERARLETDHWTTNTNKSCHQYNKVVDSRARTNADGALQQQARRQLEVFQSQVPGGQLQVIKTHTVSSSRWSNKNTTNTTNGDLEPFENLQFPVNPLDLTSQKSKAIVARSVGRRPPTRIRQKEDPPPISNHLTNPLRNSHITAATNLHRVSRLCHQIHENAVKQAFGKYTKRPSITERESGDGSVEIYEIENVSNTSSEKTNSINGHTNLSRTKSTSSDDIFNPEKDKSTKSIEDLEDLEQLQNWRRSSKIRRSLQFPKTNNNKNTSKTITDLPANKGSVRKIRDDLEKGRRLNTALRGNNVDLEALDQILQSISSSSSIYSDKNSTSLDDNEELEQINGVKKEKRNSFVTVETLQEIKGRLRRTSSPSSDIYKISKPEDPDDGIVTEDLQPKFKEMPTNENTQSRVKSYVYGMEAILSKKPVLGTGSLESRNKLSNVSNNRSEDWYNRRKSYGFEQVQNGEDATNSLKSKNHVESSTDSGICRSSEIVVVTNATKKSELDEFSSDLSDTEDKKYVEFRSKENNLNSSNVKKITSLFDSNNPFYSKKAHDELTNIWNKRSSTDRKDLKSTTITIPIVSKTNHNYWNEEPEKDMKRHSIAVDESKYVTKNTDHNYNKRTSLALNDKYNNENFEDENSIINKKGKKVEFCKTEVHFAAESGKVNIVETDEKPPPTNNFRRRRRNSGPITTIEDFNKNGLPVLHFGDTSYEKSLFGLVDNQDTTEQIKNGITNIEDVIYENLQMKNSVPCGTVTVNTNTNYNDLSESTDKKDFFFNSSDNENIKGILKNKPIKPKPYHLGAPELSFSQSDDESKRWGIKLKPVSLDNNDPPIWRSTVTVQNTLFDNHYNNFNIDDDESEEENTQPEFQKLLKNLKPVALKKPDLLTSHQDQELVDNNIRIISPLKDNRRSSWSVADKVKLVEDTTQWTENKGYSTKVNIGNGEATVIENNTSYNETNRHPTWPRKEETSKERKQQILNKGLVVRIGRDHSTTSTHRVCSKTTTNQDSNNTTTTTKITIDLSPSPPTSEKEPIFQFAKYQRSHSHSFKSTSLILNTIKNKQDNLVAKNTHPLETLKKMYEDDHSESDADKEVQLLMNQISEKDVEGGDNGSVISGSWSKMRAYKTINEHFNRQYKADSKITAQIDEDSYENVEQRLRPNISTTPSNANKIKPTATTQSDTTEKFKYKIHKEKTSSPIVLRKINPLPTRQELKKSHTTEKLHSPSLVGQNSTNNLDYREYQAHVTERLNEPIKVELPTGKESLTKDFKNVNDTILQNKHVNADIVLRQPKKSEMTYFGVRVSPKPTSKKNIQEAVIRKQENKLSDKPDLLQHHAHKKDTITKDKKRQSSPDSKKNPKEGPIYENINIIESSNQQSNTSKKNKYGREFDSTILDELTKAADQILQAVNGYTDEDSLNRLSTDDDDGKKHKQMKPLDTISETKSWKRGKTVTNKSTAVKQINIKTKQTSSTSSVESISREPRKVLSSTPRKAIQTQAISTTASKKKTITNEITNNNNNNIKANTKARRLQRASSREALLQSHGSSSEDLTGNVDVPTRKPRLIKKTKATQLTITNGLEIKKSPTSTASRKQQKEETKNKTEERVPAALPEIRHKTAVSTIRSTAEKASRDRSRDRSNKIRSEDPRKRIHQKKETSRGTSLSSRTDRNRSVSSKETVTHRTSTAYVPAYTTRTRSRNRNMHAAIKADECPCFCS